MCVVAQKQCEQILAIIRREMYAPSPFVTPLDKEIRYKFTMLSFQHQNIDRAILEMFQLALPKDTFIPPWKPRLTSTHTKHLRDKPSHQKTRQLNPLPARKRMRKPNHKTHLLILKPSLHLLPVTSATGLFINFRNNLYGIQFSTLCLAYIDHSNFFKGYTEVSISTKSSIWL